MEKNEYKRITNNVFVLLFAFGIVGMLSITLFTATVLEVRSWFKPVHAAHTK